MAQRIAGAGRPRAAARTAVLASLTLGAWFLAPAVPMLWEQGWQDRYAAGGSVLRTTVVLAPFVVAALVLALRPARLVDAVRDALADPPVVLLVLFLALATALAGWSVAPVTSLTMALLTLAAVVLLRGLARAGGTALVRVLPLAGLALLGFVLLLYLAHGFGNRSFGGTQPNMVAKVALVGAVLGALSRRPALVLATALAALVVALAVSSRGALVVLCLFWAIRLALLARPARLLVGGAVAAVIVATLALADLERAGAVATRVLALDDPQRGLAAGLLTGRPEHWAAGLRLARERPAFGYGFATRIATDAPDPLRVSAHSGLINALVDNGILGTALLLAAVGLGLALRLAAALRARRASSAGAAGDARRIQATLFAFAAASLGFLVLDPAYLSLGHSWSVALLWAWVAPRDAPMAPAGGTDRPPPRVARRWAGAGRPPVARRAAAGRRMAARPA
jgi:O-antigen ligase